MRKKIKF